MSRDVGDPGARQVTFDQLVAAYYEQARGLLDGGVDLLLPETAFDTLNLKAALFAIQKLFADQGRTVPILASITFTQVGSDRMLTGQTVEACWNSIAHAPLLGVGINCSLGRMAVSRASPTKATRPRVRVVSSAMFCAPAWKMAMQTAFIAGFIEQTPGAEWTPPPMPRARSGT